VWSRVPGPRAIVDACGRAARRSVPALAASVALAAVGGGVWLGYQFVTTSSRFAIDDIQVHGASRLSADEVRAALPVKVGDNVFTANLDGISDQLLAHPWVASAEVHRILPHTVVVDLREYEAAAMVTLPSPPGSDLYLVDGSGHPFKRADLEAGDGEGLPIVTGLDRAAYQHDPAATAHTIASALDVLGRWRAAGTEAERPAIGEIQLDSHGGLTLRTYDHGTAIQLGEPDNADELAARMRTFDAAWAELSESERTRARAIHLDARPDHVIVAFAKD
jgi:cell division protein FtsQ